MRAVGTIGPEQVHADHTRTGGIDAGAAFVGWLVATAIGILLTALFAALGGAIALTRIDNVSQMANDARTVGLVGALAVLVTSAVAYYAGGFVAAKLASVNGHDDGARQGLGVWLINVISAILLGTAGALFGSAFNLLHGLSLPSVPVDGSSFTNGGLAAMLAVLILTALSAISGGRVGLHHRRAVRSDSADDFRYQRLAHHH